MGPLVGQHATAEERVMTPKQKDTLYWHAYFAMDASLRDDERAYAKRKSLIAKRMAGLTPFEKVDAKNIMKRAMDRALSDYRRRNRG
jgi:hypothetical protein